ncbi:MAG: hypothetical protein KatS3mg024_2318 [Armatimonadota bacterium]|jgi:hypothetical protein|nr:MAG: hypothetical protein KatS3mg024_2318 [Armatimonadota bacterium]
MPFRDGTGPLGEGPMTGRGLGPCSGNPVPFVPGRGGFFGRGRGRGVGLGLGLGLGRGWGARWFAGAAPASEEDEKSFLRDRVSVLESALAALKKRLSDLEQDKG